MLSFGPLKGRLHPAGLPILGVFALITLVVLWLSLTLGAVMVFVTFFVAAFFREPLRVPPEEKNVLVAPADGLLVDIRKASPPQELGGYAQGEWHRLSIFLSVFDVHVTRMPEAGRVLATAYHRGKFFNASLDKASEANERNSVVFETAKGPLVVTQIAGLIARRILCEVSIGDTVQRGQTYGIIRFGSRVDLYVPKGTSITVQKGQRMVGGETIMARF